MVKLVLLQPRPPKKRVRPPLLLQSQRRSQSRLYSFFLERAISEILRYKREVRVVGTISRQPCSEAKSESLTPPSQVSNSPFCISWFVTACPLVSLFLHHDLWEGRDGVSCGKECLPAIDTCITLLALLFPALFRYGKAQLQPSEITILLDSHHQVLRLPNIWYSVCRVWVSCTTYTRKCASTPNMWLHRPCSGRTG